MRKLNVSKRITREQRRIDRLWADADKQRTPWRYAGDGLEHCIVGGLFDVWRKRPTRKTRDSALVRI